MTRGNLKLLMTDFKSNLGDHHSWNLGHVLKITFILDTYKNNVLENRLYQYENELVDDSCSGEWV